ncbi:restriction endonuclease subunit M [Helicobacter pylori]|nr:restriction endonuclease subunit M [Helicobacter pylori]
MKNGIIAYLSHKRTENARNKNNILCYNEAFKGRADNAKQNR